MTPGDGTGTMPGNKGYTLLELLLTITIIALLTALAAQAYSESKRKAMPEYNSVYIHPDDIQILVKTYDRCYECHASASIPFYYAE